MPKYNLQLLILTVTFSAAYSATGTLYFLGALPMGALPMGVAASGFAGLPTRRCQSQVTVTSLVVANEIPALRSLSFLPGCTGASCHAPTDYLGVSLNTAGSTKSFRESCSRVAATGSEGTSIDTEGPLELPFPSPRGFPPPCGAQPTCSPAVEPRSRLGSTEWCGRCTDRRQPLELKILIYW